MNQRFANYLASLQRKPTVVAGHVASVAIDPDTGQQTHAQIAIGANILTIKLDAFAPALAQGDAVRLAQYGQAASAEYRLAGLEAGGRANTGLFPVLNDGTVLGGVAYPGGDYIFGKLDEGNIHIEAQTGRLYQRVGFDVQGILYPDGKQLFGHCVLAGGEWTPTGANLLLSADAVRLRSGDVDTIRLTTDGTAWLERKLHVSPSGVIQVGDDFSAHIRMGRVIELDANGNPIYETIDRFAIRMYDGSGMPRIGMLTGTPDAPLSPAWLLGLKTDANYLHYQSGLLDLRGNVQADSGRIGLLELTASGLRSLNGNFELRGVGVGAYGEGLILVADVPEETGVIRWIDANNRDWNIGIEFAGYDPAWGGYVKYSGVSTPEGVTQKTKHVWVSGGWGSANKTLEYHSDGSLLGAEKLYTRSIIAANEPESEYGGPRQLSFSGMAWDIFIPPTAIPVAIYNGTSTTNAVEFGNYGDSTRGVHARVLANNIEIIIPLDARNTHNRNDGLVYATRLRLVWEKVINGAYLSSITLVGQNTHYGTKYTLKALSNVQSGTAAGVYETDVIVEGDTPIELPLANSWYYLVVVAKGMSVSGDARIFGAELTLCDSTYRALNYGV